MEVVQLHCTLRFVDKTITIEAIRLMMEVGGEQLIHATDAANCNILHYACMAIEPTSEVIHLAARKSPGGAIVKIEYNSSLAKAKVVCYQLII